MIGKIFLTRLPELVSGSPEGMLKQVQQDGFFIILYILKIFFNRVQTIYILRPYAIPTLM